MENKYFVPSIEDIRVGYELEINWNRGYEEVWVPIKIRVQDENFAYTQELSEIVDALDDGMSEARVAYLTKEQIEAEGWEFNINYESVENSTFPDELGFLIEFENGYRQYTAYYDIKTKLLRIEKIIDCGVEGWIYQGKCKDINTFRYICKLLEI